MGNDFGGVIVGYFTKIALVLSIFALLSFDAVSVGATRIGVEDIARQSAAAGAEAWNATKDQTSAYRAALDEAEANGATIADKSFSIASDGSVTVTVEKDATTLLLYRTKKTDSWTHVSATATRRAV